MQTKNKKIDKYNRSMNSKGFTDKYKNKFNEIP